MLGGGWKGQRGNCVSGGGEGRRQSQGWGLGRKAPEGRQQGQARAQEWCQAMPEEAPRVQAHGQHVGLPPGSGSFYLQIAVDLSQDCWAPPK